MDCNCENCGANLEFKPDSQALSCNYCGHKMEFATDSPAEFANIELDLDTYLSQLEDEKNNLEAKLLSCEDCGATTHLESTQIAGHCAFCDAPIVSAKESSQRLIKPAGLLPFRVDGKKAQSNAKIWIGKRWFAPNDFKNLLKREHRFKGIYLPYWTYDCDTLSRYIGQRGTHYYVSKTVTGSDGKRRTRRVRRTRWSMTSGKVSRSFDDILVPATTSLPTSKLEALEPWDLNELEDYQEEYIRGFIAEAYQLNLRQGYDMAKVKMKDRISKKIRRDIGGDEQRILSLNTHYSAASFKHILLPVWVTAYRYKGKIYQLLVNARTGEVQGERPWSWLKLGALAICICALIAAAVYFLGQTQQ